MSGGKGFEKVSMKNIDQEKISLAKFFPIHRGKKCMHFFPHDLFFVGVHFTQGDKTKRRIDRKRKNGLFDLSNDPIKKKIIVSPPPTF